MPWHQGQEINIVNLYQHYNDEVNIDLLTLRCGMRVLNIIAGNLKLGHYKRDCKHSNLLTDPSETLD